MAVLDLNLQAAEAVVAQIRADGGVKPAAFQADITQRASVDAAVVAVEAQLGPVDVLVNNACWDVFKPFTKTEPAQWDKLIAIPSARCTCTHGVAGHGCPQGGAHRQHFLGRGTGRSSGEAVYAACSKAAWWLSPDHRT